MTDDTPRNDDQSKGRSGGSISRRGVLMTGTALAASGLTPAALTQTSLISPAAAQAATGKKPNIVMLMTDDTGWNDFGCYSGGGAGLGHPTPNIDRMAKEGAVFTSWYGQASCTAGRASFMTGRIPIRSALSIVVAPGDRNSCARRRRPSPSSSRRTATRPTSPANGIMGDKPEAYPTEHGFDEMKHFAAYYAGVYSYNDTDKWFHPWFPSFNPEFEKHVRLRSSISANGKAWRASRRRGSARSLMTSSPTSTSGRPTRRSSTSRSTRRATSRSSWTSISSRCTTRPTRPPTLRGKSHLGDYSDSLMEMDDDIGRIMDAIREDAPNTIVIVTADNGAWLDAYPDAGHDAVPRRKRLAVRGRLARARHHVVAGAYSGRRALRRDDVAYRRLVDARRMVGLTPPPHGEWKGNDGKPIYFDSIDNSDYIFGKAPHSARKSWVYIDGETFQGARADIGGDPNEPWVHIAWKYLYTAKDSWLGPTQNLGAIGALYNLTMDPYEKYDMIFNGAAPSRIMTTSPGRYAGQDNGWALSLVDR